MSFKFIATTVIIFAISFLAYKTMPLYYANFDLKGQMQAQINKANIFSDQEMRNNIFEKINKLDIPIEKAEQINIERSADGVVMNCNYQESIDLEIAGESYHLFTLEFSPEVWKE